MINKLSKWNPKTLISIHTWAELLVELCTVAVVGIFALFNIVTWILFLFISINTEQLSIYFDKENLETSLHMFKGFLSRDLDIVLILIVVGVSSLYIKFLVRQAINLALLRDTTVSKFVGPFGFEISKRYLPESSKWRSVVEPSEEARSIHILSRYKKVKIKTLDKDKKQIWNYYHEPFYFTNGLKFSPRMNKISMKYLAKKYEHE